MRVEEEVPTSPQPNPHQKIEPKQEGASGSGQAGACGEGEAPQAKPDDLMSGETPKLEAPASPKPVVLKNPHVMNLGPLQEVASGSGQERAPTDGQPPKGKGGPTKGRGKGEYLLERRTEAQRNKLH